DGLLRALVAGAAPVDLGDEHVAEGVVQVLPGSAARLAHLDLHLRKAAMRRRRLTQQRAGAVRRLLDGELVELDLARPGAAGGAADSGRVLDAEGEVLDLEGAGVGRSEERRVGKEGRRRLSTAN